MDYVDVLLLSTHILLEEGERIRFVSSIDENAKQIVIKHIYE